MDFHFGQKTWVMGILNVTPDSFSDGGSYTNVERAVLRAKGMIAEGADMIDIGGESTRPGHTVISDEEEISRVVPVIEAIVQELDVPLSIDTYKSAVAKAAIEAGAHVINDVWGGKHDPEILRVAADKGVPIILMHNRDQPDYEEFWQDAKRDLEERIEAALAAGVKNEHIWLDPGIGFGKTTAHNLEMMQRLDALVAMGYPVLLGTSRKSFIGKLLDLPVEERLEGSLSTVCFGAEKGCHIVRVHDVKETARALRVTDALSGRRTIGGME
ncbi:dihydropteroate synthase [Planomicrobium sp. YIM 101495]|uniref:dihydropteroate synthase n=1 Tax=Planomicrobium sp. YIM 101495 TaxID=2665160 RepID=UPI0012B99F39|nr:dihydropteroate synthase [Planomicrobium sp. YIM 101495]MTD32182.1 dihydropteroate synthase [Planomicrobium sp. YIM 101495]